MCYSLFAGVSIILLLNLQEYLLVMINSGATGSISEVGDELLCAAAFCSLKRFHSNLPSHEKDF